MKLWNTHLVLALITLITVCVGFAFSLAAAG